MNRFRPGQLSASDAAALNELAAKVDGLSRMTVAAPLAMTKSGGAPLITTTTFETILAEITEDDGGDPPVYKAKRMTREGLDPALLNTVVDFVPETIYENVLNPLGGDVIPSTTAVWAAGTLVQLVPITDWRGWYWAFQADAGPGFFAELTATDAVRWDFYRLTYNGTAFVRDGDEVTGYLAKQVPFGGTGCTMEATVGSYVWMINSNTSPYYEFFNTGLANLSYPGLVSISTQDFNGTKRFQGSVYVNWISGANTLDGKLFVQGHDAGILEPENTFTASSETDTGVYPYAVVGDFGLNADAAHSPGYGRPYPVYEVGSSNVAQGDLDLNPVGIASTSGVPLSVSSFVATPQLRMYAGPGSASYDSVFSPDAGELFMTVQVGVYCGTVQYIGSPETPFVTAGAVVSKLNVPSDIGVGGAVVLNGDVPSPDMARQGIRVAIGTREYPGLSGFAGSAYGLRYKDWDDVNQIAYFQCGVLLADTGGPYDPFTTFIENLSESFAGGCSGTGTGQGGGGECSETTITVTALGTASDTDAGTSATATLAAVTVPACTVLLVTVGMWSDGGSPSTAGPTFAGSAMNYAGLTANPGGGAAGGAFVFQISYPVDTTGDVVLEVTGGTTNTVALLTASYVTALIPSLNASSDDGGGGTDPDSGVTGTTTVAATYVTAAVLRDAAGGAGTWGGGFAAVQEVTAGGITLHEGYQIAASTGTFQATMGFLVSPTAWGCLCGAIA